MRWKTTTYGDDGLRYKYHIYKDRDAQPLGRGHYYLDSDRLGANGEFAFVLRPETDEAAWHALVAYSNYVRNRAPKLADDLDTELKRIFIREDNRG